MAQKVTMYSFATIIGLLYGLCAPCSAAESVTSAKLLTIPPITKPGYLQSINDPAFGNVVTRVTEPAGDYSRHHYPHTPPWNVDGSLLDISKDDAASGSMLLRGTGYTVAYRRNTSGECKWHPARATKMVCLYKDKVYLYDAVADTRETLFDGAASRFYKLFAGGGQFLSDDANTAAAFVDDLDGRNHVVVIDLATRSKVAQVPLPTGASHILVSPSGRYVVVHTSSSYGSQNYVYDRDGRLVQHWREDHRPGHGDLTVDAANEEVFVGVSKSDPDKYQVIKRRLRDGAVTPLTTPGRRTVAQHVSCRNIRQRGWCYVAFGRDRATVANSSYYPLYQECVALRTDGSGEIRRIAHTRTVKGEYEAEAHCTPSFDGSKVIFASNWGDDDGSAAAYVVNLAW